MDAATRPPGALQLAPDLTVGDGLREMLSGALGALHRHDTPTRAASPEAVHRFRIGLRRVRSILSAFSDVLPERERRALGGRLRATAQRYGRVREWDVFLTHTVAALQKAMPDEPALAALRDFGEEARRRALPQGDALKASIAGLEEMIESVAWLRRPPPALTARWDGPLCDYAGALLGERDHRLRKHAKEVDLADQAAFHRLRVRVKKLRYPAELLKSLFDERRAAAYLDRLVRLQDVLGRLNDAFAARQLVTSIEVPAEAQHLVFGWIAHEVETQEERFPAAARALRHVKPFWDR